jgi:hypothetical protein
MTAVAAMVRAANSRRVIGFGDVIFAKRFMWSALNG